MSLGGEWRFLTVTVHQLFGEARPFERQKCDFLGVFLRSPKVAKGRHLAVLECPWKSLEKV